MVASEAPGFVQLGHYPAPRHTLVHVSDTHFLAGHAPLYGAVDTDLALDAARHELAIMSGAHALSTDAPEDVDLSPDHPVSCNLVTTTTSCESPDLE